MFIPVEVMKSINCAKYMSGEKSYLYRVITRIFLEEHEKMHTQLNQEELFAKIESAHLPGLSVSMQELAAALDVLEEWGCLESQTDHTRQCSTVESFKRRQSNYTITNLTLEFERILKKEEQLRHSSLSVERTFERIANDLMDVDRILTQSPRGVNAWWNSLVSDHDTLQRTNQEYAREFLSARAQQIFTTSLFAEKKAILRKYLIEFVKEMQTGQQMISQLFQAIDETKERRLIEHVVTSLLSVERDIAAVRSTEANQTLDEEKTMAQVSNYWNSLKGWFVGNNCGCSRILTNTDHIIMQMTSNAMVLLHTKNIGLSSQADLKKIMCMFAGMDCVEEAHKLSSLVFGVPSARHYYGIDSRPDKRKIDNSTYDEAPISYELQSQTRGRKPKKHEAGSLSRDEEKRAAIAERLRHDKAVKQEIFNLRTGNQIDFATINHPISFDALEILLGWISVNNTKPTERNDTRSGYNLYGHYYTAQCLSTQELCVIPCERGLLTTPHYVITLYETKGDENL